MQSEHLFQSTIDDRDKVVQYAVANYSRSKFQLELCQPIR